MLCARVYACVYICAAAALPVLALVLLCMRIRYPPFPTYICIATETSNKQLECRLCAADRDAYSVVNGQVYLGYILLTVWDWLKVHNSGIVCKLLELIAGKMYQFATSDVLVTRKKSHNAQL